jgi:DNA-binding transcriptional MerR regulator
MVKKDPRASSTDELEGVLLPMASVEIPILTSVEVTEILNINPPRLERFQDNYPALRAGRPGKGRGSRRLFSPDDVLRIAIAKWLLDDGFQPTFVGEIMTELQDRRLSDFDERGDRRDLILMLERDESSGKRTFELASSKTGEVPTGRTHYYSLNLSPLSSDVCQRIRMALERRIKGKTAQVSRPRK